MIEVRSFVDEGLGHSSYLVDLGDGRGLVVDPPRIPDRQIAGAEAAGLEIAYTADTHSHADYVSGSPLLASWGARFIAPHDAHLQVAYDGLRPDDERELAPGVVLRAIATPGHTPEHLAYLLCEDGTPVALFSGGSLMVGTVGRTDLLGVDRREELARRLFRALRDEVLVLPDDLPVYPTHGAGSFCSAPAAGDRTTTIGHERATNPLLQVHEESAFVDALVAGLGTFPTYFCRLPEVNRRGPRLYEKVPALERLDLGAFRGEVADEALVVDVRPIGEFARGHVPGALSLPLRPVFGGWLGWLVEPNRRLVFVVDDHQDRADLVRQCLNVGYENLVGELDGGMSAWRAAGLPEVEHELVGPDRVDGTVVDVRQRAEYDDGHLPGAVNVELGSLPHEIDRIPDGPLTLVCRHGERATTAASILEAQGRSDVRVLTGGPAECAAATGCRLE